MLIEPEPIRPRKLSQEVQERLLKLIRDEGLSPDDPLPSERELMSLYQVGRPTIREAMQNLQRMGLVEIRHGERPKVAAPTLGALAEQMSISMQHLLTHSASSLDHLKEARARLESDMARIAAERRTVNDLDGLQRILDRQGAARRNPDRFLELDGQFHRKVASISGNPIFESVTFAIFNWLRVFHVDQVRKPNLETLTLEEHGNILGAIREGDAEAAARAMHDHLMRANQMYRTTNLASVASRRSATAR